MRAVRRREEGHPPHLIRASRFSATALYAARAAPSRRSAVSA